MMPIAPEVAVRPLRDTEKEPLRELLNHWLGRALYSTLLTDETLQKQVLQRNPGAVFSVRWQKNMLLGAWRAGQLVGAADIGIGLDSDRARLADYQSQGLMRFLALPERAELVTLVGQALLQAADRYWKTERAGYVQAFHMSTGYPVFQGGAGFLPSDWGDQFRILTEGGFQLAERHYLYSRMLERLMEETTPAADLSLNYQGGADDRRYTLYHRRSEQMGRARVVRAQTAAGGVAHLVSLEIDPPWRNRNIGQWLLRRLVNDATLAGFREMIAYVAMINRPAMNMLAQNGFQEVNYRGYVLEKSFNE